MAKATSKEQSVLLPKLKYYTTLTTVPIKVWAGWDMRARNKDGNCPAQYMRMNEFGSAHVPPRRMMKITADRDRKRWQRALQKCLEDGMEAKAAGKIVGELMAGSIRQTISGGVPPPNSPATIARKAKRMGGTAADATLRDTLFALQSVNYFVGKKPK